MSLTSGSAIQYIATSVVMLVASLSFEAMRMQWSLALIATVVWMVPPLTAIEAFLLFNERLGVLALAGMALAMLGVALVLGRPDRK